MLFRSLSVATSLGASLILALTLMPVMMSGRRKAEGGRRTTREALGVSREGDGPSRLTPPASRLTRLGASLAHLYESGMSWCLAHPRRVFGVALATVLLTAWIAVQLPREILPQVDEGTLVAELSLPEGTALEETERQVGRIEAAAKELGAGSAYARVGAATNEEVLAGAAPGSSAAAQLIIPAPSDRPAAQFADQLRALYGDRKSVV